MDCTMVAAAPVLPAGYVVNASRIVDRRNTCNEAKSDRLAAISHLGTWWRRNREHRPTLSKNFDHLQILHNLVASETVALWAYQQAEYTAAMVWLKSNELVRIPPDWITSVVGNVDMQ
jgi:hypothetical protein